MRLTNTHAHRCSNHVAGCKGYYRCPDANLERNHDPDGVICGVDPMSEGECEDCNLSRCSDCGEVLHLSRHVEDCPKATAV